MYASSEISQDKGIRRFVQKMYFSLQNETMAMGNGTEV